VAISTVSKLIFAAAVVSVTLVPSACLSASDSDYNDLHTVVRNSPDVCSAVGTLYQNGREAEIAAHALRYRPLGAVADPRNKLTSSAWAEAEKGDYGIQHYLGGGFNAARIKLTKSLPPAWVFSTNVGSVNNPILWIFSSTRDGRKAAHLIAQLGFEASGPFDTYFLHFNEQSYAVTQATGENGTYLDVYSLNPATIICSFRPRQ
jgi:hypothetical protein